MNSNQLKQLKNNVEVVGMIKSKSIELKVSRDGKSYLSGNVIIQSTVDNTVQEHLINVFAVQTSKLYKNILSVKNEYRTIEQDGAECADVVKIKGTLKLNEFYNDQGSFIQFNSIRGMTFQKLSRDNTEKQEALASIEMIIDEVSPKLDEKGNSSGSYLINGFTVGWKSEIIELKDVFIDKLLAEQFIGMYKKNSTGLISFKINSMCDAQENMQNSQSQRGFGNVVELAGNVENKRSYKRSLNVIGGTLPYDDDRAYSLKDIESAKRARKLTLDSLKKPSQNQSQFKIGFDSHPAPKSNNSFFSSQEMPDFA